MEELAELATKAKALAAFARNAPQGNKEIDELDDQKHITHTLKLEGQKLAALIVTTSPTIANIATLEAYKIMYGWKYAYIIAYNSTHVYYVEVSQIDAIIAKGQLAIDPKCMKKVEI